MAEPCRPAYRGGMTTIRDGHPEPWFEVHTTEPAMTKAEALAHLRQHREPPPPHSWSDVRLEYQSVHGHGVSFRFHFRRT